MQDHVYKIVELAGSSETSIDDAILTAVARAGSSLRHLRWFEVQQIRGHIEDGEVSHYQVVLKVGFTLDEEDEDDEDEEEEEDEEDTDSEEENKSSYGPS